MKKVIREKYDSNFKSIFRLYETSTGTVLTSQKEKHLSLSTPEAFDTPFYAHICLTNKCNLHCPYCYARDNTEKKDMSKEEILMVIDDLDKNGVFSITWTGGEPFFHEDITELVLEVNKRGISQTIITNGTYIPSSFLKCHPKNNLSIQISLNEAWNNDEYNTDMHSKIWENYRLLQDKQIECIFTIIMEPRTKEEIISLISLLIRNQVKTVRFGYLLPVGEVDKNNYATYIQRIRNSFSDYKAVREQYKNQINIKYQFDVSESNHGIIPRRFSLCEAGTSLLYIDNNGDTYPCPLLKSEERFFCGNILVDELSQIWAASILQELRHISPCMGCEELCKNWCPAIAYFTEGVIGGNHSLCIKGE